MNIEPWSTHFIAFLLGAVTGAAGHYLGEKYTDKRRKKESEIAAKSTFDEVCELMPDLIQEMNTDFTNSENATIREFAILPNSRVVFNSSQSRLVYYEEEHDNLRGKVSILENHGYVIDVTTGNAPIYKLSESFVVCVKNM